MSSPVHHSWQVKGFVFGREGCLEFYELVATITPSQFVGVAHVDDPNMRTHVDHAHLQVGKQTVHCMIVFVDRMVVDCIWYLINNKGQLNCTICTQVDEGQQWFDLGWLFHPQDVISNLSHYLAETLAGDSPSSADDSQTETPTKCDMAAGVTQR